MGKDLIDKVLKASEIISKRQRQPVGNYIVTSGKAASEIQKAFGIYRSDIRKKKINRIFK